MEEKTWLNWDWSAQVQKSGRSRTSSHAISFRSIGTTHESSNIMGDKIRSKSRTSNFHYFETVLYSTVQYCIVLYCTVLYSTVLHCTVLYCTALYCTVLYCTVLYCTVLYCTVLHCSALYCTLLYCTVLLPPGVKQTAVKYIISYRTKDDEIMQ